MEGSRTYLPGLASRVDGASSSAAPRVVLVPTVTRLSCRLSTASVSDSRRIPEPLVAREYEQGAGARPRLTLGLNAMADDAKSSTKTDPRVVTMVDHLTLTACSPPEKEGPVGRSPADIHTI